MSEIRQTVANTRTKVVGTASSEILGPAGLRVAVILCPPNAGRVTYSFLSPAVIDQGITLDLGASPLKLTDAEFGDQLSQPLFAVGDAAGRVATVIEFLAAP